jgi:hypothetical protein
MKAALTLLMICLSVWSKKITQKHTFSKGDFQYSTKFGAPANEHVIAKVKTKQVRSEISEEDLGTVKFFLAFYRDDKWDYVGNAPTCKEKKAHAMYVQEVDSMRNGQFSRFEFDLYSADRPHIFYMAVLDCDGNF